MTGDTKTAIVMFSINMTIQRGTIVYLLTYYC